jgi:hypothetical protein
MERETSEAHDELGYNSSRMVHNAMLVVCLVLEHRLQGYLQAKFSFSAQKKFAQKVSDEVPCSHVEAT